MVQLVKKKIITVMKFVFQKKERLSGCPEEVWHIDGLVQNCSNSIANALELVQSCTKPLIYPAFVIVRIYAIPL